MDKKYACVAALLALSSLARAAEPVSFSKEVKPILEAQCTKCHGASMQMAKLDLRSREAALTGGEKGPAIVPGKAEESSLYRKVAGLEKPAMPMGGKLTAAEIDVLRRWIGEGANWDSAIAAASPSRDLSAMEDMKLPAGARDYWAFRSPVKTALPTTGDPDADAHPVDAFLRKAQLDRGLKQAPLAGKRALLRRAYLDLTGLPPTDAEAKLFLDDNTDGAWERLIDRLLASPQYGERWGRHWLDVARYADSNGYEHDFDRPNAWRYRDYVIRAFNSDIPYNRFLEEQLAGDELETVTHDTLIATGFLRNYAKVGFREKDNPQFRFDYLDDMIATVGRGLMGLTLQCARCHNHKFDPLAQKDYYRLQATLWGYVEVDHALVPEPEAKAYYARVAEVEARIKPLKSRLKELLQPHEAKILEKKYRKWPANIQEAVFTPEDKRTPGQVLLANQIIRTTKVSPAEIEAILPEEDRKRKTEIEALIRDIERERPKPIPVAMGITDGDYRFTPDGAGDEPAPGKGIKQEAVEGSFLADGSKPYAAPPSYFLHSGDPHNRGSQMQPGFVMVVDNGKHPTAIPPANGLTSGRRLALARWLGSKDHPLTARVIVNRVWHHHFGRGIVTSLDNFGKAGETPTHPELLDWLAVEFMDKGWSIKKLHKLLMTSRAYRLSSQFNDPANQRADADNLYFWRFKAQRLEAEAVRDSILAVSGSLNRTQFGPAVFPEIQEEILRSMDKGIWLKKKDGPEVWRRSVYVYRKRGLPLPFFEVFDLPDQNVSCGRRNVSTVPTQALTLMNNEWVLNQSRRFADRIATEAPGGAEDQVKRAYQLALSRPPTAGELRVGREFLATNTLADFAHVVLNLNEFVYLR
ncbi:MAG: PSD1 and planctomycete cytochrome C domain-containing protein [Bryobacteraceae bacterium]